MQHLSEVESGLAQKYLIYMSAVAHSRNARKMENRRNDLLASIQGSLHDVGRMPGYEGDFYLRDTYLDYLKILNIVFREEYHKILDLEKIAEESYDNMEAYLLAQRKANEKLREAAEKIVPAYEAFAASHHVQIVESDKEDKTYKKLERVAEVNRYYDQVYLLFFKCVKQEVYLVKAMDSRQVSAIEQERSTLLRFVDECWAKLDSVGTFNSDGSLKNTTRNVLTFLRAEAVETTPLMMDFIINEEEFRKLKEAVEAQRTNENIEAYNKAVDKYKEDLKGFNGRVEALNNGRGRVIEEWNKASANFLDNHMPG